MQRHARFVSFRHVRYEYEGDTTTSVLSNLTKGRIADLSAVATAKEFVRSLSPSITWFLGPTRVNPPNGISIGSPVFCTAHPCAWHTDRHTYRPRYVWHLSQSSASMLCMRCDLKLWFFCAYAISVVHEEFARSLGLIVRSASAATTLTAL